MAWVRLDDKFVRHPKILALGTAEKKWTWLELLSYTHEQSSPSIPSFIKSVVTKANDKFLKECVAIGLLDERDGKYEVHDWILYSNASIGEKVRIVLERDPSMSSNEVVRQVGGTRQLVLEEVRKLQPWRFDSGSDSGSASGSAEPAAVVPKVVLAGARPDPTNPLEDQEPLAQPAAAQEKPGRKTRGKKENPPEHDEVIALLTAIFGYTPSNDTAWGPYHRWAKGVHQGLVAAGTPKDGWEEEIRRRARALWLRFGKDKDKVTVKVLAEKWDTVDAAPQFAADSTPYPDWVDDEIYEVRDVIYDFPASVVWSSRPAFMETELVDLVHLRNKLNDRVRTVKA